MTRLSVFQGYVLFIWGLCAVTQASLVPLPGESDPAGLNPPSHKSLVLPLSKEDLYPQVAEMRVKNHTLSQHINTVLRLTHQILLNYTQIMEQTKALLSDQELAIRWKRSQLTALKDGMENLRLQGQDRPIPPESIRALIQKTALMMPLPRPAEENPDDPFSWLSVHQTLPLPPIESLTMNDLVTIKDLFSHTISLKQIDLQAALEECQEEKIRLLGSLLGWHTKLNSKLADQFPDFRALQDQYQDFIQKIRPVP